MENDPHILVADDDSVLAELLRDYLSNEGFQVSVVHDGQSALDAVELDPPALIVLDIMMPVKNGYDTLRALRERHSIPVIMLTARGEDLDRIMGLEMGADDYLPKPCNPRELVARVRAVLRRAASPAPPQEYVVAGLRVCPGDRSVFVDDKPVVLTSTEFSVLELLISTPGQVVEKEQIYEHALGRKMVAFDRSADMHVSHLRRKIGLLANGDERIKTVRGQGYLFALPSA